MWPETKTEAAKSSTTSRKKKRKCRHPLKTAVEKTAPAVYNLRRKCLRKSLNSRNRRAVVREAELERRLYRVYRLSRRQNVLDRDKWYERVTSLLEKWCCPETLKTKVNKAWLERWCEKYNVDVTSQSNDGTKNVDADVEQMLSRYDEDEVYMCFCFQFRWSSLPDQSLAAESDEDVVWLLMAANRSGRHRTRLCVIGKEWRPGCLEHVNMLSQPVVYAGGGDGHVTSDLFAWWFYHEFSPGALTINRKVALVTESKALDACASFVSEDVRAKVVWLKDTENSTMPENNVVLTELRIKYAQLMLSSIYVEERNAAVLTYLAQFTLKDAFPMLHRAWLTIRIETFARSYKQLFSKTFDFAACMNGLGDVAQINGDGRLLLELQWMSHDLGLEVTDSDLIKWACTGTVRQPEVAFAANHLLDSKDADEAQSIPSAAEAVMHLSKALLWMETEALDPNYLLFIRNIILVAKQARDLLIRWWMRMRVKGGTSYVVG